MQFFAILKRAKAALTLMLFVRFHLPTLSSRTANLFCIGILKSSCT